MPPHVIPILAGRSYPLSAEDYALVVAALRSLEDSMEDAGGAECLAIATECVSLRAKLRAAHLARPALAVVIPIREGTAPTINQPSTGNL